MIFKSVLAFIFALSFIHTTIGSRSLMFFDDSDSNINEIIQDFLDGDSSPSSTPLPSLGSRSPFLDILRITTRGDDSDDSDEDNDVNNPFSSFFGRFQNLADEPDSVFGSIFQGNGINIRDLLNGAGY
eukprot:TRINITY_DN83_c0_g1_i11.p2 TRINITY_DN83_c0_g1~~TRINITY_DN83_c0_g1_i11.p2  ORF type:complete len:128 (+),score=19.23 TRINITY_DN83_c0_g1_i11:144-527(+)